MRYHLSIHDMNKTHLDGLDKLARTFIKKWLMFPTRGVTDAGIFHPYLLNVKQPSQLYFEGHASNMLLMRLRFDITVNTCMDSKLERERLWTNKSSTAVKSDNLTAHTYIYLYIYIFIYIYISELIKSILKPFILTGLFRTEMLSALLREY